MHDHKEPMKPATLRMRLGRLWNWLSGQPGDRDFSVFSGDYDSWRQRFVLADSRNDKRRHPRSTSDLSFHFLVSHQEENRNQEGAPISDLDSDQTWERTEILLGDKILDHDSNDALWTILINRSDSLLPLALRHIHEAVLKNPAANVFYGDEEFINQEGQLQPFMKPRWSPELWESTDYLGILAIKTSLIESKISVPDLVAEILGSQGSGEIVHIPHVLCRRQGRSGAYGSENRVPLIHRFHRSLGNEVESIRVLSESTLHVQHALPNSLPKVSIIIPSRDRKELLSACVDSLVKLTTYENFEILLIDNDSQLEETKSWFQSVQTRKEVRVLSYPHPFNFAAINNFGARSAQGEILVFLNDDTTVIDPNWLTEMVRLSSREPIGAVGALLYYPNDTIQHAGVVCGISKAHIAGHIDRGLARNAIPGPAGVDCVQNYSVVTGACTAVRRKVFEKIDGFDERFSVCYNDVDLCLRIKDGGFRNVWTPHAILYHHENISVAERNKEQAEVYAFEAQLMRKRYGARLLNDPAYNPNFALDGEVRALATQPRIQ